MRIMIFCGGRMWAGAKSCMASLISPMRASMGVLSSGSKGVLRGANQSRLLLRARERRNFRASGVKWVGTFYYCAARGGARANDVVDSWWRTGEDMKRRVGRVAWSGVLVLCGLLGWGGGLWAQADSEAGRSIGRVSTRGDLIVLELDEGA